MKNNYIIENNVIKIYLQNNLFTIIDKEDFDKVSIYGWYAVYDKHTKSYYVRGGAQGIRLHRLITNCPSEYMIDHINRDTLDNRKENLRIVSNSENQKNASLRKDNTSGRKGISYEKGKRFKVEWYEEGKKKTKSFSINKYGFEEALKLANSYRDIVDKKLNIVSERK